eukprot:gene37117-50075_t
MAAEATIGRGDFLQLLPHTREAFTKHQIHLLPAFKFIDALRLRAAPRMGETAPARIASTAPGTPPSAVITITLVVPGNALSRNRSVPRPSGRFTSIS